MKCVFVGKFNLYFKKKKKEHHKPEKTKKRKKKKRNHLLSGPPSWVTASTKRSWRSAVQRRRGLGSVVKTKQASPGRLVPSSGPPWKSGWPPSSGSEWIAEYIYQRLKNAVSRKRNQDEWANEERRLKEERALSFSSKDSASALALSWG